MNADASALAPSLQELLRQLAAWLVLAVLAGPSLLVLWRLRPRQRVWPVQRQRLVTWTMLDFALILVLYFFCGSLVYSMLTPWFPHQTYVLTHVRDFLRDVGGYVAGGFSPLLLMGMNEAHKVIRNVLEARQTLYAAAISFFVIVVMFLSVLRMRAGARPLQMGLSLHRWRADLVAGFWTWLFVTPVCYTVFWAAQLSYFSDLIGPTQPHKLMYLISFGPTTGEWLLLLFATVIAAPVLEEIFFRGVLLKLLTKDPLLADATIITGLLAAITTGIMRDDSGTWLPMLFLVAVGGGYMLFEWIMQPWLTRPGAARAIFASSLFFAALHMDAWPSPIPLFLLSLGLGFVAYRTQSLWGAILMHALFNLVNFVALALPRWPS